MLSPVNAPITPDTYRNHIREGALVSQSQSAISLGNLILELVKVAQGFSELFYRAASRYGLDNLPDLNWLNAGDEV